MSKFLFCFMAIALILVVALESVSSDKPDIPFQSFSINNHTCLPSRPGIGADLLPPGSHCTSQATAFGDGGVLITSSEHGVRAVIVKGSGWRKIGISGLTPGKTYHRYIGDFHHHEVVTADENGTHFLNVDTRNGAVVFLLDTPSTLFIVDDGIAGTGGDCELVGDWDGVTKTCKLTSDIIGNSIEIDSSGVTLDCRDPITNLRHILDGQGMFSEAVFLPFVDNVTVRNCEMTDYLFDGVFQLSGNGNIFERNHIHDNGFSGLFTMFASAAIADSNTITHTRLGVFDQGGTDAVYSDNVFSDNSIAGMSMVFAESNIVRDNSFINNLGGGLRILFGGFHDVVDNTFIGNGFDALPGGNRPRNAMVIAAQSANNRLIANTMNGNAYGLAVTDNYDQVIDINNTVNGKKIYYLSGLSAVTIDPAGYPDAAAIYCAFCDGVVIENFMLDSANGQGVVLGGSTDSTVRNVHSANNGHGVMLQESDGNTVTQNTLINGLADVFFTGLYGSGVSGNTFSHNTIDAAGAGFNGVAIFRSFTGGDNSNDNDVIGNVIDGSNFAAISIQEGSENLVDGNTVTNSGSGIHLSGTALSSDNILSNNEIRDGILSIRAFNAMPAGNDNGISVNGASNTVITRNIVTEMKSNGLFLAGGATDTRVFQNDIYANALSGQDAIGETFQVKSVDDPQSSNPTDVPIQLSVNGVGNYWGRDCPNGPFFVSGTDSNALGRVKDNHPFGYPVAGLGDLGHPPQPPCLQ